MHIFKMVIIHDIIKITIEPDMFDHFKDKTIEMNFQVNQR